MPTKMKKSRMAIAMDEADKMDINDTCLRVLGMLNTTPIMNAMN